jgi:hypothetical protein
LVAAETEEGGSNHAAAVAAVHLAPVMALLAKDDLHDQPWKIVDGGHQEKADLVQLVLSLFRCINFRRIF